MSPILDFRDGQVVARDTANQGIQGRVASRTVRMGLFQTSGNAIWAADRMLRAEAFCTAPMSFPANRNLFRLEPGDPFLLNYAPYGVTNKVCRVRRITEEAPESETITVECVEDINYISRASVMPIVQALGTGRSFGLAALTGVKIIEAPYPLSQEDIRVMCLAGRVTGNELGYKVYFSLDGSSYELVAVIDGFSLHATLVDDYSAQTDRVDDAIGFEIDFDVASDAELIQTITRDQLWGPKNIAMLGDEIISFQTITPVSGVRYKIENVYRGRIDTVKMDHTVGEDFYFISQSRWGSLDHPQSMVGSTRYVKMVPYNNRYAGDPADASPLSITLAGRARTPYPPIDLAANGDPDSSSPTYTADILLEWYPRVRETWNTFDDPEAVPPANPEWEGLFKVEVWVEGVLVNTIYSIDAAEYTYTEAQNISDNGGLADRLVFKVSNYRIYGGVEYESAQEVITVRAVGAVTTTTTTTTTTSSTSTSSSSTTSSTQSTTSSSRTTSSSSTSTTTTAP